jgi:hypothetical protein
MFETLSTIELTVSASIVVAFLAPALARTWLGRLAAAGALGAWFELVLAIGATGALDPVRGPGAPALGLTVGLPIAALVCAFFAAPSVRNAMLATPLPALVTVNAIRIIPGAIFVVLYAAGRLPAAFGPSGLGRHFRRRHGAPAWVVDGPVRLAHPSARAFMEYDRDRGPHRGDRAWRTIRARSASGVCWPADQRHHDHPAVAHHSGVYRAEPHFHSHRHLLSLGEERNLGGAACAARRRTGEANVKRVSRRRSAACLCLA